MSISTKELVKNIVTRTVKSAITKKTIHTEDTTLTLIHTLQNTALPHTVIHHPDATPHTSPGNPKGLDLAHQCGTVLQMSKNTLTEGGNDVTGFLAFIAYMRSLHVLVVATPMNTEQYESILQISICHHIPEKYNYCVLRISLRVCFSCSFRYINVCVNTLCVCLYNLVLSSD